VKLVFSAIYSLAVAAGVAARTAACLRKTREAETAHAYRSNVTARLKAMIDVQCCSSEFTGYIRLI